MSPRWQQVIVAIEGDRESEAADLFAQLGALAVTSHGSEGEIWLEHGVADSPQWQKVELVGLFDDETDVEWVCAQLKQHLSVAARFENLADQDWVTQSQQQTKPTRVGRGLWICPSWADSSELPGVTIKLDPGLAFGTGTHATTAMCLDWLSRVPRRRGTLLDYGCGSGVLSIAALLLGFEHAVAVDIDPQALRASNENAAENAVHDRILVQHPQQLSSQLQADIVIANILAGTIESLSQQLADHVRPGGWLVLSGILGDQAGNLMNDYFGGFEFVRWQREQWVLLAAVK